MKHFLHLIAFLAIITVNAQQLKETRFIVVNGSVEMSLKPDEIEFEIYLAEYSENDVTVKIDKIEAEFYVLLEKNGIKQKDLMIENSASYYWWHWWYYWRTYTNRRVLRFKVQNNTDILKLVKSLDKKWVQSLNIINSKSNEIQRYRKEVKIAAMKAAKEKAAYLLESVDEQLGGLISVEETPEYSQAYYNYNFRNNVLSNSIVTSSSSGGDNGIENMAEIKVRYEVKAKFEIK